MCQVNRQSFLSFVLLSFFVILLTDSCVTPKKVVYFNDLKEDSLYPATVTVPETVKFQDPKIEVNDILGINLQTLNQNEGNAPIASISGVSDPKAAGYPVDKNGNIEISL